ncbi:MAG: hypothetical protein EAZ37_13830 [Burkholderiales bacterium]|nr:MAG: hypothetical protein EAZ37_13830 [Burkholderiales bacterium]
MQMRLKRWQLVAASLICLTLAAIGLSRHLWLGPSAHQRTEQIVQLTQRCQTAMLRDTCTVMKGSVPSSSQARLFIAGIGEVDAQAFASLKAAGDKMCQELNGQCQADWSGQACKIGRALYPELTKKI